MRRSRTFSPGGTAERLIRAGCSVVPTGLNPGGANHVLPGQKSWAILRSPSGTNVGKKLAADSRGHTVVCFRGSLPIGDSPRRSMKIAGQKNLCAPLAFGALYSGSYESPEGLMP